MYTLPVALWLSTSIALSQEAGGAESDEENASAAFDDDARRDPIYFRAPVGSEPARLKLWVNGQESGFDMAVKLQPEETAEVILEDENGRILEYQSGDPEIDIFQNLMDHKWGLEAYIGRSLYGDGDWAQVGLDGNFMDVGVGLWRWIDAFLIRLAIHRSTDSASPPGMPLIQYRSVSYRLQAGYEWSLGSGNNFISLVHLGFASGFTWGLHRLTVFGGSLVQNEEGEIVEEEENVKYSGTEGGLSTVGYLRYPISQNFWFLLSTSLTNATIHFVDLDIRIRKPSYEWNAGLFFAL